MAKAKTKKIRITLAALTRVEYNEIVEVPVDMTEEELDTLVDRRYDEVDGGEYSDDPHFWQRGESCGHQAMPEDSEASIIVQRDGDDFTLSQISAVDENSQGGE